MVLHHGASVSIEEQLKQRGSLVARWLCACCWEWGNLCRARVTHSDLDFFFSCLFFFHEEKREEDKMKL